MNIMILEDFMTKYQEVKLIRYEGKTSYIVGINKFPYTKEKMSQIIKSTKYGDIYIRDGNIEVHEKIKHDK